MKTSKLLGFLAALLLLISVNGCTTYYNRPAYGRHYGYRRSVPPTPPARRPYGYGGYYGRPGW